MRFRLTTILLCLAFSALSPDTSSSTPSKFDSENWVRAEVNTLVSAAHAAFEDDDAVPAYHKALAAISRAIRRHRLDENKGFVSRYREFMEYVRAASVDQMPDHELGFDVSDKQYFRETRRYVEIPDFLLNRRFLSSVTRWETLDRAKAFLREINSTREPADRLIFFSFTSRHLGTPDNDDSYRRLLIVVPGNTETGIPEKWVQFGVTDPGTRVRTRNLSVVSAVPNGNGTFNTYFKDYFRTYRRGGSIRIKGRWELGYGDDNCARCHKSGVLPIFPEEGSVNPSEQPAIEEVNRRFRTYGSPRFDKYLDESKFGPGLGSGNSAERNKRFGDGFSGSVVGRSMNCAVCHRPERLGYLNWPMEQIVISSYIKGGHMPLGNDLKEPEREELYEKIIEEYFAIDDANPGILKAWLLGDSRARSFQKDGGQMTVEGRIEFQIIEQTPERVIAEMPIQSGIKNPHGGVHAGAMLWFADVTATYLALGSTDASPGMAGFPLAITLNANFAGNQSEGTLKAIASFVKKGRTVSVVRTTVFGENDKLIADVTTTHILSK